MAEEPIPHPTEPAAVVRSYLASFATADPDRIAAHVADRFVNDHTAALGQGCTGRDEYRRRLPGFLADMVDLRYDIESIVADGRQVAVGYRMTARWQGVTPIDIRGAQYLEVTDGEIVRRVDYWDSASFLLQISEDAAAALAPFGVS